MKSTITTSAILQAWLCSMLLAPPYALSEEKRRLETIVVTATRNETQLADAPASISVVNREQLQQMNADDLADALTAEVGLTVTSVGQGRQGISIRGMPVEHTLYLIDGRRISSSNSVIAHSDYELNWLPDSAIERIEVVRGPMSSLYGADALGGVINIISRPPGDEFFGELSSTASRWEGSEGAGSQETSVYLTGPLIENQLSFNLSGQTFDRDSLTDENNPYVSDVEERESRTAQGTLFWAPAEGQKLTANYSFSDDERARDVASGSGYYTSSDKIDREQLSLSYQAEWQQNHAQLNAYSSKLEVKNHRTGNVLPTRPRTITDNILDGHAGFQLTDSHLFTVGGQLREETLEDDSLTSNQEASATHQGVFLQDEWKINQSLQIVAGLGLDKHEDYGSEVNPRLYAVYQLDANWTLKGGYGEGFRAPSLTELAKDYEVLAAGGRFWVEGNPDLEPERSATYELGLEYTATRWAASARLFENQLDDLVQAVCYDDCGIRGLERRNYQNLDESLIRGAELSMNGALWHNLTLGLNYTYLDTENLETGDPLEDRPQYMTRLNISWQPLESLQIVWRSEFNGKQYTGNNAYVRHYDLHHIDISMELGRHVTLYTGVENLFDERLSDESDLYSLYEPGREFRLGFTARF